MKVRGLTKSALMSAVLCVISPFSIPLGAVSLSLATFGVYLCAGILKPFYAVMSVAVYIMLGVFGLPVFSGFSGGFSVLAGPTGGFITGYILCAAVSSFIIDRYGGGRKAVCLMGLITGTLIIYISGAVWFFFVTGISDVWKICVLPFLPADLIKMTVVTFIYPKLKKIEQVV